MCRERGCEDLLSVVTGRQPWDEFAFRRFALHLLTGRLCNPNKNRERDKNSQCLPRPHPPVGWSWRCRGDLVIPSTTLHKGLFCACRFSPRPSEKCLRVSLTNTQNPLVGVRVRVGVGAVASSAWLDKWKFECQWQGVCTGQPVGAIYSSWWSWWQGVYGAAVECGYRQVLRQRYWRVV